jgi:heptosyltransferase-2
MSARRILVAKLATLGDMLLATPALRALRLAHPGAEIAVLATPSSAVVLDGNDAADRVIRFDKFAFDRLANAPRALPGALALARQLRGERFDSLILLHHLTTRWGTAKYAALTLASGARMRIGLDNGRGHFLTHRVRDDGFGAVHEADYWLRVVGLLDAHSPRPRLELFPAAADRAGAARRWAELGLGADVVAIHPGCGAFSPARRWDPARFAEVADLARERLGLEPLILAGPADGEPELAGQVAAASRGGARVVVLRGRPQETAALLAGCRLFVGNDSGVMHLAVAAGIPVVAVFGPSNDRAWGPYPPDAPRHAVVRARLACSPCIHVGHSFGTPQGCPARTCLDLITARQVVVAAERVLEAVPARPRRAREEALA